jgi:outer membrane protein insertion porin family
MLAASSERARVWVLRVAVAMVLAIPRSSVAGTVAEVRVEGNRRVETSAITARLSQKAGQALDRAAVDSDVKEIYRMGFFESVWVTLVPGTAGEIVVYHVEERPYVDGIEFKGVKKVKKEDLEAVINITPRTIFDPQRVWEGIREAEKFYSSEGYPDATIEYALKAKEDNTATLEYTINEGKKIRIEDIRLEGVNAFSKRKLRRLMTTRKKWMFSFLTGAGLLNQDELATDVERLRAFYYDNGYVHVRIDEPLVERVGDGLVVTMKIEEGPQFHVGSVSFGGDVLMEESELRDISKIQPGDVFRASAMREAMFALTEAYGNLGHAFAKVEPDTDASDVREEMDVRFTLEAGPVVTIRRIDIRGNSKTRDKVIRRELTLEEGVRFSGSGLKDSENAVRRLGFFEDVKLTTARTEEPDQVDMSLEVKEGRTGSFSAGAGFSSADNLLFNARIGEENLFGRGQKLSLNADIGTIRRNLQLSFTEPWFTGRPLSAGIDLFSWQLEFDRFSRGSTGFGLRASYPLRNLGLSSLWGLSLNNVRAGTEYRLENAEIDGVSLRAPPDVVAEEGTSLTSSLTPSLVRSTLDHPFDPATGSRQSASIKLAGLGGDSHYFKLELAGRWFWPVTKFYGRELSYSLGARVGYGLGETGESGEEIPVFERYFPGGINSIRGWDARQLGPRQRVCGRTGEDDGGPNDVCTLEEIGGSQQLVLNNELIFPIIPDAKFKAVAFLDAGNAFLAADGFQSNDMRYAAGWGFRWLSPFGPLRIEVGYPLNPRTNDDRSVILFSFGAPF